jgi:hypothetical protein
MQNDTSLNSFERDLRAGRVVFWGRVFETGFIYCLSGKINDSIVSGKADLIFMIYASKEGETYQNPAFGFVFVRGFKVDALDSQPDNVVFECGVISDSTELLYNEIKKRLCYFGQTLSVSTISLDSFESKIRSLNFDFNSIIDFFTLFNTSNNV